VSLGLVSLTLCGDAVGYPQLGGLLAALPHLRALRLCADKEVVNGYFSPYSYNKDHRGFLSKQLLSLAACSSLQALRIDGPLEEQLGPEASRKILPPTLTALTCVVDDALVKGRHLTHLVNLRRLYMTGCTERLGAGYRFDVEAPLTTVEGLMALPALQEVHIGERKVEWAAALQLAPKLVTLKALWAPLVPDDKHMEQLSALTALSALELELDLSQRCWDGDFQLPVLPRLRHLHLATCSSYEAVCAALEDAAEQPALEHMHLEIHIEEWEGGEYWYYRDVVIPKALTRLTGFSLEVRQAGREQGSEGKEGKASSSSSSSSKSTAAGAHQPASVTEQAKDSACSDCVARVQLAGSTSSPPLPDHAYQHSGLYHLFACCAPVFYHHIVTRLSVTEHCAAGCRPLWPTTPPLTPWLARCPGEMTMGRMRCPCPCSRSGAKPWPP
jgi:hypothetical protein